MKEHDAADATHSCRLISALADGEADAADLGRGCALWAGDATARERWHAYHLIGDVLRSEDLARRPQHDHDFLRRLSARLQDEPAVLAPAPPGPGAAPARRRWALPVALAAGVMALATAVGLWSANDEGAAAPKLALASVAARVPLAAAPSAPAAAPAALAQAAPAEAVPVGGRMVRDTQLDSYLRAHRDYAAALPGSLPGGSGRSLAAVSYER
ncbi:MAG TPA: sigma-E factor negative regulatory protein [Rubrivivax sp.]|nr:sigma-E factor negative regulatory protein [Rubrivivax sp.]